MYVKAFSVLVHEIPNEMDVIGCCIIQRTLIHLNLILFFSIQNETSNSSSSQALNFNFCPILSCQWDITCNFYDDFTLGQKHILCVCHCLLIQGDNFAISVGVALAIFSVGCTTLCVSEINGG